MNPSKSGKPKPVFFFLNICTIFSGFFLSQRQAGRLKKKNKDRTEKEREKSFQSLCTQEETKQQQDTSFTGPCDSLSCSEASGEGAVGVEPAQGLGWLWWHPWAVLSREDSFTKLRWKCVEFLEFAVLCWELLGSFLVTVLLGAAGFCALLIS